MENINQIIGNQFTFETCDKNYISVLEAGYIIDQEGDFISVKDREDHADKFTKYLAYCLGESQCRNLTSIDAARCLTELGCIVYFGLKTMDTKKIYGEKKGLTDGFTVLILPTNLDLITDNQKDSIVRLLNTNKSIFGNHPILDLQCVTFGSDKEIEEEQLRKFCQTSNSRKK